MELKIGNTLPAFSLPGENGQIFDIRSLLGKKALVIYFYPKDDSAGCTKQACAFRDHYLDFKDAGAEVIGISSDTENSHGSFAQKHKLPFILLSDIGGNIRKLFGVPASMFGLIHGRVTYIIDKKGILRFIFNSQLRIEKHISEALRILKEIE